MPRLTAFDEYLVHQTPEPLSIVQTHDGRTGTGIIEITGAHHHRYFPDTSPPGPLPT